MKLCHLLLIILTGQQTHAKTFTLKDLIQYGMTHSAKTRNAKSQTEIQELRVKNAFAQFLPSLDLTTDLGYQRGGVLSQANQPFTGLFNLTLSETLYNNGIQLILYDIAKQEHSRSIIEYTRDQNQLCLDIFRQYSYYSLLQHLLKAQNTHYQLLLQQSQSMENRYLRGEEIRINFLRFQAQVQRTQIAISHTKTDMNKALEQMKSIIGFTDKTLDVVPMNIEDTQQAIDLTPIKDILTNHYEHRIAQHNKDIYKKQVDLEKRQYGPELSLNGSASYTNPNYMSPIPHQGNPFDLSAFLTLRYNLWDWGIRRRNVAMAQANAFIANNNVDSHLLMLRTQIENLFLDIKRQMNDLNLSKELMDLEKENYDFILRDWYNGQLTFLDLINAFNNYVTAQESYYRSFFSLQTFFSEYKYHKGQLYESLIQY